MNDMTLPEMGRSLIRIEEDLRAVRVDQKDQSQQFVGRREYDVKMLHFDKEFNSLKLDLASSTKKITDQIQASKVSWPSVVAAICAVVSSLTAVVVVLN